MLIQHLLYSDLPTINQSSFSKIHITTHVHKLKKKNIRIPYLFTGLLISQKDASLNLDNQMQGLASKKLMSRNFLVHLINKYWQETIFLSKPSTIADHYSSQLKSDGIAIYKNKYKKFLFEFSKALVTGRIQASLNNVQELDITKYGNTDIKYVWRKGINVSLTKNFLNILNHQHRFHFPTRSQQLLIQILKNNQLPIFTITNNFNQIVIAEPSDELIKNKNILDGVYRWYHDIFMYQSEKKPVYEGLFFVNPEDALEYQRYITKKTIYHTSQNNFNIFASSLDFYYKLVRKSPPRVQFRLIPDLKELGDLLYKYQFQYNVSFHNKQKYGRYYFQGQPIYIIQPIIAKNKQTKAMESLRYNYNLNQNFQQEANQAVFLNYKMALLAWRNFIKKNTNYNLPNTPKILVYNLEDFLKVQENNSGNLDKSEILIIPNKESYEFIKSNNMKKSNNKISHVLSNKLLSLKIITKRVLWSLTSRQPINW